MSSQRPRSYVKLRFAVLLFVFGCLLVPSPALPADDDHNLTTSEVRRFLRRARVDSEKIDDFLTRYRSGEADETDMRLLAKQEKLKRKKDKQRRRPALTTPAPSEPAFTTRLWDGGSAANANWTSSDNWTTGAPDPTDILLFGGTTRLTNTNNFTAGTAFSGLGFAAGAGEFTLSGNSIKLTGSIINNSSNDQNIDLPIILDGNITVSTPSPPSNPALSNDLFLNGNVNLNGATRTFTGVTNGGQVHFGAGGISGSAGAGVNFVTIFTATGAYVPFIFDPTNVNTYTGKTTIGNGAFLVLEGTTTNGAIKGDVLVQGNGVVDYLEGVSEQIADNATVTVNSAGNSAGTLAFGGFDLFKAQGTETETIGALLGSGTVWLSNSTLAVGSGSFTGVISDGTHGAGFVGGKLTKYGAGTLSLSGANTYTGGTTLSAGTLNINNAKAIGTGAFTIAGGTIDNTSVGSITLTNNNTQNWNGNFTFTGTRALNLGTGAVTMSASRTVTANGSGALTVGGVISGAGLNLTKAGTGTLVLKGVNLYTGTTTVSAGNLQVGVGGAGTTGTGATTVDAGATLSGTGIATTTTLNGTLKPGDSGGTGTKGTLTINGDLTATSATSALTFDITNPTGTWAAYVAANPGGGLTGNATTELNTDNAITAQATYDSRMTSLADFYENTDPAAGAHDKLKVLGTFTINGNTTISVNNVGATLVAGQVFNIIDASTFATTGFDTGGGERSGGTAGNLILPTLNAAFFWDTTKFLTHGLLVVVDPPAYWSGGATAGGSDPTSWDSTSNWVHGDGSAVERIDASMHLILSAAGAQNQNRMSLNRDMTIRELTVNDAAETTVSGAGTLKIAPVVDDGTAHNAITVNSGAGRATINTGLRLSQGARITVNNVDTGSKRGGLVLRGHVSAKKKLIKSGPGRLTFENATMAIGDLHGTAADTLDIQFEGSGGITLQDTTLQFDLFSHGTADKLSFIGSVEGGNDVLLQDTHFELAAAEGTELNDGESWDILDWSNLDAFDIHFTGDMASYFNLPTLGEGQSWGFDRFASEGVIYVVPEPSRAVLMLVGLILISLRRRRR